MDQDTLGFPLWLWINHVINLFCRFPLIRSGIQIFDLHPNLYWYYETIPGSKWANSENAGDVVD